MRVVDSELDLCPFLNDKREILKEDPEKLEEISVSGKAREYMLEIISNYQ